MKRRKFLQTGALASVVAISKPTTALAATSNESELGYSPPKEFELDELTISDLQAGMKSGKFTSRSLVKKYLERIDEIDKHGAAINSIIEVNPDAVSIAESLDLERKAGKLRGPLHGIPILIKDNIDTADRMMTTAGSLALLGSRPLQDSFVAKKLREAGAVLLGKTNLSEWANIR
ncbi:MAG: amidase family protein, partial [Acidobacteriota bacterium]|nr:amidase family protein [Acidobacteriota bacterium]